MRPDGTTKVEDLGLPEDLASLLVRKGVRDFDALCTLTVKKLNELGIREPLIFRVFEITQP